jgi:hypothetical protein
MWDFKFSQRNPLKVNRRFGGKYRHLQGRRIKNKEV